MTELLIGCGHRRHRLMYSKILGLIEGAWDDLVTLDINPNVGADIVHDLNEIPYPFPDREFDEIHAYEVLEHCGRQGDWQFFFDQFTEFHRLLKDGGRIIATVPKWDSVWAYGDPSHTRVIPLDSLVFLQQWQYEHQADATPMTDFRYYYKVDFKVIWLEYITNFIGAFVLEKA